MQEKGAFYETLHSSCKSRRHSWECISLPSHFVSILPSTRRFLVKYSVLLFLFRFMVRLQQVDDFWPIVVMDSVRLPITERKQYPRVTPVAYTLWWRDDYTLCPKKTSPTFSTVTWKQIIRCR